jgi:hypothetical protein
MNAEVEQAPEAPKPRLIDFIVLVNERADYLTICEDARQKSYGYRYAGNDVEAEKYRALGRFLLLIESRYGEVKQLLSRKPRR